MLSFLSDWYSCRLPPSYEKLDSLIPGDDDLDYFFMALLKNCRVCYDRQWFPVEPWEKVQNTILTAHHRVGEHVDSRSRTRNHGNTPNVLYSVREEGRIPMLDYLIRTCSIPISQTMTEIHYSSRFPGELYHIGYETKGFRPSSYWKEVIATFQDIEYRSDVRSEDTCVSVPSV